MKRSSWLALGVSMGLGLGAFGASPATAQQAAAPGAAYCAPGSVAAAPTVGATVGGGTWGGPTGSFAASVNANPAARSGAVMPYSYYVNFPEPSRIYVGYGPNDGFPFQGNLYGHAGDRWSWSAMSTGGGSLARYYYQILR